MQIFPCGSRPTRTGGDDAFVGDVRLDPIIAADPAGLMANTVSFAPGGRTNWHSHAAGQTLLVTQGSGLVCLRGERPRLIRAGDTVWIEADVEHWHGASPSTAMTHIAMQLSGDGKETAWFEPVSDADYTAASQ